MFRAVAFVFFLHSHVALACESLVLGPASLGPLSLAEKTVTVSEEKLKKLFPGYVVKYEIGVGDSPDFHYFVVSTSEGETLFTIKSFIADTSSKKTSAEVPVSLLQVHSRKIRDIYGLRVGDHVREIVAKRGDSLSFGAGHHDVLLGGDKVYYSLVAQGQESPEGLTMQDAVKGNWEIRSLSWPEGAWE